MATQPFQSTVAFSPLAAGHHFSEDGKCPCCHSVVYAMNGQHEECRDCGFSVDFDQDMSRDH